MYICGQHFSKSILDQIQGVLGAEPSISRRELSRRVCGWLGWRSPSGQLQEMSCRNALAELDGRGIVDLPVQDRIYGFEHRREIPIEADIVEIACTLSDLGEVGVQPISSRYCQESKIWSVIQSVSIQQRSPLLLGRT